MIKQKDLSGAAGGSGRGTTAEMVSDESGEPTGGDKHSGAGNG